MVGRRLTSKRVALSAAFLGLAANTLAACGSTDDDEQVYCVDQNDTVVDDDYCDDGYHGVRPAGLFFLAHSARYPRGLQPGAKLPAGGTKFAYNDTAARTAFGLPSTGRVENGHTVRTGSVGGGGSGTHAGS
jgi:hypothetical protein